MAAPTLTYTLTNGATADASQVMQNYNDLLNGITDGSKDLTISALTVNGAASFKGAVTLGDATADDITHTGSLASTIPIKTTGSYDIGSSTLGLRAVYFGANSQTVNLVGSASMSATWTLTLPVTAGAANGFLLTNGSGVTSWSLVGQIPGTATNDTATAGNIGEYLENISNSTTINLTNGTTSSIDSGNSSYNDGNETGISLTAGTWDIQGIAYLVGAAGTTASAVDLWIGTAKGNSSTGQDLYRNLARSQNVYTAPVRGTPTTPVYRVKIANGVTTPYYLKINASFAVSTMYAQGSIHATRVR